MTAPQPGTVQAPEHAARPVPGPPPTATAGVQHAVARLAELDGRPLVEHVAVLDDVHRALQDALAELDEA